MEFEIENQERYFFKGILIHSEELYLSENDLLNISLKNIELVMSFERNSIQKKYFKKEINNLFIYKYNFTQKEVYLLSRSGYIELDALESFENHLIEFSDFNIPANLKLSIEKKIQVKTTLEDGVVSIASPPEIFKIDEKVIKLITYAISFLKGSKIKKRYEHSEKTLKIYLSGQNGNVKTNLVISNYLFSNKLILKILKFFNSLSEKEKEKWFRLYTRNILLRSSSECISDFNFFETARNNPGEHFAKTLENEFGLDEIESKFIKNIRIGLVHNGLLLEESIEKNLDILKDREGELSSLMLTENEIELKTILFTLYMEKLSNQYIISKLPQIEDNNNNNSIIYDTIKNEENVYKDYEFIYTSLGVRI